MSGIKDSTLGHLDGNYLIDKFTKSIGKVVRWLCVILVLLQFYVVIARYFFDYGSVMAQEGILVIFGTMFMLSFSEALQADRHVRVDMLYHNFSEKTKCFVDAIGIVVFLLPFSFFILWVSWDYVVNSWLTQERSRDVSGLPGVYLFKTIILISFILLILQAVAILVRCFLKIKNNNFNSKLEGLCDE